MPQNTQILPIWLAPHFMAFIEAIKVVQNSSVEFINSLIISELSRHLKDYTWNDQSTNSKNLANHIIEMTKLGCRYVSSPQEYRTVQHRLFVSLAKTHDLELLYLIYKGNYNLFNQEPFARGLMQEYSLKMHSSNSEPINSYCIAIIKTKALPRETKQIFVQDFVESTRKKTLLEILRQPEIKLNDPSIQDTILWMARYSPNHAEAVALYDLLINRTNAAFIDQFLPKEMHIRKALYGNIDDLEQVLSNFQDYEAYLVTHKGNLTSHFDQIIERTLKFTLTARMQGYLFNIALCLLDNKVIGELYANPKQAVEILKHLASIYAHRAAAKILSEVYWNGANPGKSINIDKAIIPEPVLSLRYSELAGERNSCCLHLYAYVQRFMQRYLPADIPSSQETHSTRYRHRI